MKKLILLLLLISSLVFSGCSGMSALPSENSSSGVGDGSSATSANGTENNGDAASDISGSTTAKEEDPVEVLLKSMSLEEKVGQVFMVAFRTGKGGKPLREIDDSTKQAILDYKPGGVILFAENIDTITQTCDLIEALQAAAKTPLFIGTDEEGGSVSRLNYSGKMHATKLPGNSAIGAAGDPELAYRTGVLLGEELSSLGFNMDFAPVADVNTNPKNPVIGKRAFGSDPEEVAAMVEQLVKGLQDQGICSVLKHFPGHGDTSTDTHSGATYIYHDKKRLEQVEFVPFRQGIAAGADMVMTAHIQLPEIIKEPVPATLSKEVLTDILRKELGFTGLIITDALEMGAVSKYWTSDEAAVKAFEAGADILLMPADLKQAYQGLLDAVNSGRIREERLDASVRRILTVKYQRGILRGNRSGPDPETTLGNAAHEQLAREIRERSKK